MRLYVLSLNLPSFIGNPFQPSHDHSSNDASDFRIHTHAKNIGQAAEQLIQIIVKLRYKILLNDYPTIKKETQDAKLTFENLNDKTEKELNQIRDEVSEMLYKLEKSYYSTPTPSRSVTSSPCQEESHIL